MQCWGLEAFLESEMITTRFRGNRNMTRLWLCHGLTESKLTGAPKYTDESGWKWSDPRWPDRSTITIAAFRLPKAQRAPRPAKHICSQLGRRTI